MNMFISAIEKDVDHLIVATFSKNCYGVDGIPVQSASKVVDAVYHKVDAAVADKIFDSIWNQVEPV